MVLVSFLFIRRTFIFCIHHISYNGIYLGFYYVPDGEITFDEDGHATSGSYQSMELIMTKVAFGYIMRAIHHWAAHFMVAAVFLHMMRVYFVGAYRNPREVNWILGVILLLVTIFFGYTGYLLPWDALGYAAAAIGLEMATSIPAMGPLMAQIVFGGTQVTADTVTRMYWLHIFVLPLVGTVLMIIHMALVWIQGSRTSLMNENEVIEDDVEMIGESIQEQQELDTIRKLENREEHSVLEASLVKVNPYILMNYLETLFTHFMFYQLCFTWEHLFLLHYMSLQILLQELHIHLHCLTGTCCGLSDV